MSLMGSGGLPERDFWVMSFSLCHLVAWGCEVLLAAKSVNVGELATVRDEPPHPCESFRLAADPQAKAF